MVLFTEIKKRPDVPPPFRNFTYGSWMIAIAPCNLSLIVKPIFIDYSGSLDSLLSTSVGLSRTCLVHFSGQDDSLAVPLCNLGEEKLALYEFCSVLLKDSTQLPGSAF